MVQQLTNTRRGANLVPKLFLLILLCVTSCLASDSSNEVIVESSKEEVHCCDTSGHQGCQHRHHLCVAGHDAQQLPRVSTQDTQGEVLLGQAVRSERWHEHFPWDTRRYVRLDYLQVCS